ncbi:sigma-E factor negative regulatory protein [Psychromonas hadalis]|uniref:sigma-E factor negative regulatory protein n=1 Tax=Psychromonas hadalis TaxID=211669 RepID=UPI0003B41578|nr:RseA family anti-sigma factor [Psychromonas hadalis]
MKEINQQLSSLIDNENVERQSLDALINDQAQQAIFSRYQLIGDVMRSDVTINIDITAQVMAEIKQQPVLATVTAIKSDRSETNVVSFVKRFGQYAIAASVAGVVVMTSLITTQPTVENRGIEVLNTTPFGGMVSPVSLQANPNQTKQALQARHQRLEALLKDHQLQLQIQP